MNEEIANKMSPLLTIAIPTWNRVKYLAQALEAFTKQIALLHTQDIEVIVSDNASSDTTSDVVRQIAHQYDFLRYYRNSQNLGSDKNFELLVNKAAGKYVWFFCDDDLP
ncbi:MAG: glycosyltransferase family 2 protein, partial [Candidatus Omnitrophica bacterium]|nr:glycosyltransferase family 2 protein [Candidatus Omnitrophota bacterium]